MTLVTKSKQWLEEANKIYEEGKDSVDGGDATTGASSSAWRVPQGEVQMLVWYKNGWTPVEDITNAEKQMK